MKWSYTNCGYESEAVIFAVMNPKIAARPQASQLTGGEFFFLSDQGGCMHVRSNLVPGMTYDRLKSKKLFAGLCTCILLYCLLKGGGS